MATATQATAKSYDTILEERSARLQKRHKGAIYALGICMVLFVIALIIGNFKKDDEQSTAYAISAWASVILMPSMFILFIIVLATKRR